MPVKYFGIFLAYSPAADLRKEGLGRLLAAFLKSAAMRGDIRFVIACPQWFEPNLRAFCESEGVPASAFDIAATDGVPFILRLYQRYLARQSAPPAKSRLARLRERIQRLGYEHRWFVELRVVAARTPFPWLIIALYMAALAIVLFPLALLAWLGGLALDALRWIWKKVYGAFKGPATRLLDLTFPAGEETLELRLYRLMEDVETKRMRKKIDSLSHVQAWFSPTSFWPEFNRIAAPGLLCVPDVLLAEFATGFARQPELFKNFENVERTIRGGRSFVTYSSQIKWSTLVDRYAVNPADVAVVPHACSDLSPWIMAKGFLDDSKATARYCQELLQEALCRVGADSHVKGLHSGSLKFFFYASQFRPNKNVIMLLQAYNHLLRERFVHHKLILTGDPKRVPVIANFIQEYGLAKDVLFLHGLTTPELAACYYLADLAVNPSLSEGGCPFTFTEALSVNTPVVMARIPVTEEILVDPKLQEMMLFDPYNYRDASSRIEWALGHREELLSAQCETYDRMRQRTWTDVVGEYITILERVAEKGPPARGRGK
jgi:glycosyltransferase involved in cell wall biosynthesis